MGNLTHKPELNEKKGKIGNLDSPKNPFDYGQREYGTVPLDTNRAPFQWVSEVAYKNVHRIVSRGYDTTEVMADLAKLAMVGMTWFGILFSIYLTFLEPFVIGATCVWCLTSAVVTTSLFWVAFPLTLPSMRALRRA